MFRPVTKHIANIASQYRDSLGNVMSSGYKASYNATKQRSPLGYTVRVVRWVTRKHDGVRTRFVPGFAIFNIKTDITYISEAAALLSPSCGSRGAAARFRICSRKVRISDSTLAPR